MADTILSGDCELAWASGFFDGEGYVGIRLYQTRTGRTYHALTVQIGQKVRAPLDEFLRTVGHGKVVYKGARRGFLYTTASKQAAEVLGLLVPYLRVKREVAEIALRFQKTMNVHYQGSFGKGVPSKVVQARQEFREQIMTMNQAN